jgi:ATP-dependent DNA helicase RecG
MGTETLKNILDELRALPKETEWIEFKVNYVNQEEIGGHISALSNSACLHEKQHAYLVFGIENATHRIMGTKFKPKHYKVGNEELENWLARMLKPRIDFRVYEFSYDNKPIAFFEIDPTQHTPVKFQDSAYMRVGSYTKKLSDFPEKERKIWKKDVAYDWSAQVCPEATIDDLEPKAISKAKEEYKQKNPQKTREVDEWEDLTFLNKAKVTKQGQITRAAIILLGREESEHFISPSVAKITWVLKDAHNIEKDYEHFGPPFILNAEQVFGKIRNLKYRYLPDESLFPIEINQYDAWVIREALHNCIAHQDYELRGKINIVEAPDELIFDNVGHFIPRDVETVIRQDSPPEVYRNRFLADAMVNLNMIDTIGGGIRKMFEIQRKRFFPLPNYDLTQPEKVIVKIQGRVLNENYTRLLIKNPDMDLSTVMLLDKVQKRIRLTKEEGRHLKSKGLVEGRYPNLFLSLRIAATVGGKAEYIKYRGFDKKYYQDMIMAFIKENESATRAEINDLLSSKLPDILTGSQKMTRINNLLTEMSTKLHLIKNTGSRKRPCWVLASR